MSEIKSAGELALENLKEDEVVESKEVKPVKGAKYKPGVYRADKFLRIIKELTYQNKVGADGIVQKTYGTWAKEENMIIFQKGVEKRLTADDLKLVAIQRLIDSKTIYRVGD